MSNEDLQITNFQDWHLVFQHNSQKAGFFGELSRAKYSHKNNLFSVLGRINDLYKINGYFEFILVYPELKDYIQFEQDKNPLYTKNTDTFDCHISHFNWKHLQPFQCLTRSNFSKTLLEGQRTIHTWYYAIGLLKAETDYPDAIPGPGWNVSNTIIHEVSMFMKIIDKSLIRRLYLMNSLFRQRISFLPHTLFFTFVTLGN